MAKSKAVSRAEVIEALKAKRNEEAANLFYQLRSLAGQHEMQYEVGTLLASLEKLRCVENSLSATSAETWYEATKKQR